VCKLFHIQLRRIKKGEQVFYNNDEKDNTKASWKSERQLQKKSETAAEIERREKKDEKLQNQSERKTKRRENMQKGLRKRSKISTE
jgi:hypothetical protein